MVTVFVAVSAYRPCRLRHRLPPILAGRGREPGSPRRADAVLAGGVGHAQPPIPGRRYQRRLHLPARDASQARRWFHHLTFYGFLLCFAAIVTATIYAYGFGWDAPYPLLSVPVVLGTMGGVGLLVGPAGLLWLKRWADPEPYDDRARGMDVAFMVLLMLTSLTGLLLLSLRTTPAMGPLLAVHLGVVLGLFLTFPTATGYLRPRAFSLRRAPDGQRPPGRRCSGRSPVCLRRRRWGQGNRPRWASCPRR